MKSVAFLKYLFMGILFFFGMHIHAFGQSLKKYVKEGDQYFNSGDYASAVLNYRLAMHMDSSILNIDYQYAEATRILLDYAQSEKWYGFVFKKDKGKKYPLASFWYASMLKNNGKYKEAKLHFDKYYKKNSVKKKNDYYTQKSFYEIAACDYALLLKTQPKPIQILHLDSNINSRSAEFAPYQKDSTLYYSSIRANVSDADAYYLTAIYMANQRNGNFIKADSIHLDDSLSGIGNLNFTADHRGVFFTQCSLQSAGNMHCDIFTARIKGSQLSDIEKLGAPINLSESNNTQPFVVDIKGGNRILYFVSDRKGGEGKLDIWAALLNEKNACSKVYNLGKQINSLDDEVTPFYDANSRALYFSSNWHKGMGGFDIFKAALDSTGEKWSSPINIGAPINSSYNDLYFSLNPEKGNAFFVSNRKGSFTEQYATCCNDIYYYHQDVKDSTAAKKLQLAEIKLDASKEIQLLVPITLYFHNDEPNPRTKANVTTLNYLETYHNYIGMIGLYKNEYAKGLKGEKAKEAEQDILDFFTENVQSGEEDLEKFSALLLTLMHEGRDVSITLKGFCSPLASTDYNIKLAGRRLSSLRNFFDAYQEGALRPYLLHTDTTLPRIDITEEEVGELQASPFVSDNPNDSRNSIYSKSAAFERKIQIIAVSPKEKKK